MKKHICLAVILTLIFTSCSTEKEEPVPPVPPVPQSQYPEGSVFGPSGPTKVVNVTNPKTGRTWMDRNLGATRAATSSADVESYGYLYQWGRGSDGHQLRNSPTTTTLSTTDQPGNGFFIVASGIPNDWRSPQNINLWQTNIAVGVAGVNNPCPSGYRLPTEEEWTAELSSWTTANTAGAFTGPLKLSGGGFRDKNGGAPGGGGTNGAYWSSTAVTGQGNTSGGSKYLSFSPSQASASSNPINSRRTNGYSVRCIKN